MFAGTPLRFFFRQEVLQHHIVVNVCKYNNIYMVLPDPLVAGRLVKRLIRRPGRDRQGGQRAATCSTCCTLGQKPREKAKEFI